MSDQETPEFPPKAKIDYQQTADVQTGEGGSGNQVQYSFAIHQPEEDAHDFQVLVRASVLRSIRSKVSQIQSIRTLRTDIALGVATLCLGASLSAWIAGVSISTLKGITFYVISPIVGVGAGIWCVTSRYYRAGKADDIAQDVLKELPDPEKSRGV